MGELSSHNNPLRRLWSTAKGHRLILENFLSLGLINVLNSSFHLIIYPILIRRVGAEAYGTYNPFADNELARKNDIVVLSTLIR